MIDTINLLYMKWEVEWWEDNFLQKLPQAVYDIYHPPSLCEERS